MMVNFRKRYRCLLFLSCLVFGIYSCSNHQSFKESEHFLIPDETATSDIRGDVEFLSLKWPEDVMMSHITDINVYGDFIFIYDRDGTIDRKSTRLNSSHVDVPYAVFSSKQQR